MNRRVPCGSDGTALENTDKHIGACRGGADGHDDKCQTAKLAVAQSSIQSQDRAFDETQAGIVEDRRHENILYAVVSRGALERGTWATDLRIFFHVFRPPGQHDFNVVTHAAVNHCIG